MSDPSPRPNVARNDGSKATGSSLWSLVTILCGIIYPISVIVINKNLPAWTNFNVHHPLGPILTNGATLVGLTVVVGTIVLYIKRMGGGDPRVGVGSVVTATILCLIAGLLLFVCGATWFGLYRLR